MALFQNLVRCLCSQILSEGPTTLVESCEQKRVTINSAAMYKTEVTFKPNIFHIKRLITCLKLT